MPENELLSGSQFQVIPDTIDATLALKVEQETILNLILLGMFFIITYFITKKLFT